MYDPLPNCLKQSVHIRNYYTIDIGKVKHVSKMDAPDLIVLWMIFDHFTDVGQFCVEILV